MDRMRILVISDSHGRNDDVEGLIDQAGHIDMLIHCGDVVSGEDYIRSLVDCPVYMVGGNSDYNLDLPRELELTIGSYRVFVIHGHMSWVNWGVDHLRQIAVENHYDIVMFGHTHVPFIQIEDNLTILNPGSLSYPRQEDRMPTFLIMEIDEYGMAHYEYGCYKSKSTELEIYYYNDLN